jgi:hypothetical protein
MIPLKDKFGELCACCNKATEVLPHEFFKGTHAKPEKKWLYYAPLYHMTDRLIGFCSPQCSLDYYQTEIRNA